MKKLQRIGLDRSLFAAGQRVCCALSGGADSTALLLALLAENAAREPLGVVVSAVHVHHGIRGDEADGDEAFVKDLCSRLEVPLTTYRVDTIARQVQEREGLEDAARKLRYAAFQQALIDTRSEVAVTAHTLDDQAETVIMKLLRGAWTEGLGGISPTVHELTRNRNGSAAESVETTGDRSLGQRFAIVRPLLGVRRAEIEGFLDRHGQVWREDSSNRDNSLTRNRVRSELMPLLRSFNPSVDELLVNTAEIARDEEAYWAAELNRVLPQILLPGRPVRGGGRAVSTAVGEKSLSIEIERLRAMNPALRRRVVRAAARSLDARLSFEETAKLLALAGLGTQGSLHGVVGGRLELRAGLRAERSAREFRLWRQSMPVTP